MSRPIFRLSLIAAATVSLIALAGPASAAGSDSSKQRKVFDWSAPPFDQIKPNPTKKRRGGRPFLRMYGPSSGGTGDAVESYSRNAVDINGADIVRPGAGGGTGEGKGKGKASHTDTADSDVDNAQAEAPAADTE